MKLSLCALALGTSVAAFGQPVITSFSGNGVMVCSNLMPGSVATVEWASSLSGPWQTNWAGLAAVTADTNGAISVSVPMFYRVCGVAQTNPTPTTTADGMVLIPAGTFTMGDAQDGESDAPLHTVNVSAFYMDTNLVSYALWQQVYQWATTNGYSFDAGSGNAANYPVFWVDWYDSVKWCNARAEMGGLMPCYYTDASQATVYRGGNINLATNYVNWAASGYRLPTEAEWEKAARGGLSGQRFPWGNTISESQANYLGDTNDFSYDLGPNGYNAIGLGGDYPYYTSPVGSFAPNGYGLYDMAGNVWEWGWDWYDGAYYSSSPGTDPRGPTSSPNGARVIRGGAWYCGPNFTASGFRGDYYPYGADYAYGFRCVRRH
jgi:formylglycine-generating enzyme required for sulfatase activity